MDNCFGLGFTTLPQLKTASTIVGIVIKTGFLIIDFIHVGQQSAGFKRDSHTIAKNEENTNDHYSTTLNFGLLPLVEIHQLTR